MPPPSGLAPRRAAWRLLGLVAEGVPFDRALETALAELDGADRRLAHELAAGTLRAAGVLDRSLAPYLPHGLERAPLPIRNLLRLGAYQLTALDRIPPHAAVHTAVALARETGHRRAAPFVNAVLRRLAAEAPRVVPGRGSHPGWLVSRWTAQFGPEDTARLLAWNDTRPRLVCQPARWTRERLEAAWLAAGIPARAAPFNAGLLPGGVTRPASLPGYREGGFIVQDPSQRLVSEFFGVEPGGVVYDACAGPGGKTILVATRARAVVAGDRSRERVRRLAANLGRAGCGTVWVIVADATAPPLRQADAVLLDVPCLGTGVFARHPDARWRARPATLDRLVGGARAMLGALASRVATGGLLCFSTCSLEPEENEMQIEAFLRRDPRFARDPGPAPVEVRTAAGDLRTLPHRDGVDGAYAARLRRVG